MARAYSIISKLPAEGKYTVATPEKWPFKDPNKNFTYRKLHRPKSRIRFRGEEIIVQDYEKGATDIEGYKKHLHAFIALLKKENPDLVVVDNPAEVSLFTKILGYKTVVVYESLDTNDLRWRLAWKSVDKVLAPYPKKFLEKAKFPYLYNTYCTGGFTRFESIKKAKEKTKEEAKKELHLSPDKKYILITIGKGETAKSLIKKILQNTKETEYEFLLLYPHPDKELKKIAEKRSDLRIISGVYDEMYLYFLIAELIITGAGYNSVMEVCYFQKPAIAIPLSTIYGEQMFKAKTLSKIGAVKFVDPEKIHTVPRKIEELKNKESIKKMTKAQKEVVDGKGAERAAGELLKIISKGK